MAPVELRQGRDWKRSALLHGTSSWRKLKAGSTESIVEAGSSSRMLRARSNFSALDPNNSSSLLEVGPPLHVVCFSPCAQGAPARVATPSEPALLCDVEAGFGPIP